MDGLADLHALTDLHDARATGAPETSRTLRAPIDCVGTGLHSGRKVSLTLHPAAAGSGIVFHRTDLGIGIPARHDHVIDTRLCTVLGLPGHPDATIGTIEHLMAALAGAGIDTARIEVDGPEIPILDGSAAPFLFLIDCAGTIDLPATRPVIEVLRPVRVADGAAFAELRPRPRGFTPASAPRLDLAVSIDFEAPAIGRQALALPLSTDTFRHDLARARTFTQAGEVAALQAAGLALGGSLDNAVVVDRARVLNPAGLRWPDEFVRHKMLDTVGDLALAGADLHGSFVGHRSGHKLNNHVLRAMFADARAWRFAARPLAAVAA